MCSDSDTKCLGECVMGYVGERVIGRCVATRIHVRLSVNAAWTEGGGTSGCVKLASTGLLFWKICVKIWREIYLVSLQTKPQTLLFMQKKTYFKVMMNHFCTNFKTDNPLWCCHLFFFKLSIHQVEDNPSGHLLVMKGAPERILDRFVSQLYPSQNENAPKSHTL